MDDINQEAIGKNGESSAADRYSLRLVHYLNTSCIGGTEISVLNLCLAMRQETIGVVFSQDGPIIPRFKLAGIPTQVVEITSVTPLGLFSETANLVNFSVYADTPQIDRVLETSGLPAMITLQWYTRLRVRRLPIICPSSAVAAIQDRTNEVIKIPNGVDTEKFKPGPRRLASRMVVARVSRPRKSCSHFRSIADSLLAQRTDIELWLIGEEGDSTDRLKYLGLREDVADLLRNVDVVVQTPMPRQGALDLAVLEAMATGVPVVAFDVECVRECFPTSEVGILVPYGDVKATVSRVLQLLDNPGQRQRMGRQARETVMSRFDIREVAVHYRLVGQALWANNKELLPPT